MSRFTAFSATVVPSCRQTSCRQTSRKRAGFTLIELLVAMMILLILTTLSISMYNVAMNSDRTRSAARQLQSYLEGARDRAIFAKQPRGVRFLRDEQNSNIVTSMLFIGNSDTHSGQLNVETDGGGNATDRVYQTLADYNDRAWQDLINRGLLVPGARIRIPEDGLWYTVRGILSETELIALGANPPAGSHPELALRLHRTYISDGAPPPDLEYTLELAPAPLPNQDPVLLPGGAVIDLNNSKLPWALGQTQFLDLMFSPRGTVTGPAAAQGIVHFLIADRNDVLDGRAAGSSISGMAINPNANPEDQPRERRELIVTLFTRTGHISTHPVYENDLFRYAETGEVAP